MIDRFAHALRYLTPQELHRAHTMVVDMALAAATDPAHPHHATFIAWDFAAGNQKVAMRYRCPNLWTILQDMIVTPVADRLTDGIVLHEHKAPRPCAPFIAESRMPVIYDATNMPQRPLSPIPFDPDAIAQRLISLRDAPVQPQLIDTRPTTVRAPDWTGDALSLDALVWQAIGHPLYDLVKDHLRERHYCLTSSSYFPRGLEPIKEEYGPEVWTGAGDRMLTTVIGTCAAVSHQREVRRRSPRTAAVHRLAQGIVDRITRKITARVDRLREDGDVRFVNWRAIFDTVVPLDFDRVLWETTLGACFPAPGCYRLPLERILVRERASENAIVHLTAQELRALSNAALTRTMRALRSSRPADLYLRTSGSESWFATISSPVPYAPWKVASPQTLGATYRATIGNAVCASLPYLASRYDGRGPGPRISGDEIVWDVPESI